MRRLTQIFLLFFVAVCSIGIFLWNDYRSPSALSKETTVIIPRGSGFVKSVDLLAENQVIKYPLFFKSVNWLTGDARLVKAGEYRFPMGISPQEVAQMLVAGQVVVHKITIPEGFSVREVVELLRAENILEGDVPDGIAEGSLRPDTYYFTYGDTRKELLEKMRAAAQKELAELWEKRAGGLPFATQMEALILASIVEKETGVAQERPRVAAVFINRLRRGMKLQSDPTTAYGIEQQTGKPLTRSLTLDDLKTPTAFNTYTIPALPPTPICNVGRAAIEAVLHPLDTQELYFVATGSGGHNFAETLDIHNKNVREYRKSR